MSESIHANERTRQFTVLDMISRRIEDADKIKRTVKMNNAEAAGSFKGGLIFKLSFLAEQKKNLYAKRSEFR
jgi:hypothetical protein